MRPFMSDDGVIPARQSSLPCLADEMKIDPPMPLLERQNQDPPSSSNQHGVMDEDPKTPIGSTFDPFSPGPDSLLFAPMKKSVKESSTWGPIQTRVDLFALLEALVSSPTSPIDEIRFFTSSTEVDLSQDIEMADELGFPQLPVQRRLDFDSVLDLNHEEQKKHEELEFIEDVYNSLMEIIMASQEKQTSDTSPTAALIPFKGSKICPGAPLKKTPPGRALDPSICKKLQF